MANRSADNILSSGAWSRARSDHLTSQHVEIEASRDRKRTTKARSPSWMGRGAPESAAELFRTTRLTSSGAIRIPLFIGAGRGSGPGAEPSSDKRLDWPAE